MSYWKTRPLNVENTDKLKPILSNQELLDLVNKDISESKIQLDWVIFHPAKNPLDDNNKTKALNFINQYYLGESDHRMIYSKELFDYFIINSVVVLALCKTVRKFSWNNHG